MNVFITGGTGFLGQRIIKRLQETGWALSGLARSRQAADNLKAQDLNVVEGSLENIASWQSALANIDVVIHCGAPVEFWGPWSKYQEGIVDATKNLFIAAENAKVKRFIYISSESVLQDKDDLIDITESEPYPTRPNSFYGHSKMLAEQFIIGRKSTLHSIILRPTFIWGNGVPALDTLLGKINSGEFVWINQGKSSFEMVHVDNVAEAVALSCGNGQDKAIYNITDNKPQSAKIFLSKLIATKLEATQQKAAKIPNKSIPKWLALGAAYLIEFVWRVFRLRQHPPLTRFDLAFVSMGRRYDISKARKELNYEPIVTEEQGMQSLREISH